MKISIKTLKRLIKEAQNLEYPNTPDERDEIASIYSDVYKEKYGIRPRHIDWEGVSVEEAQAMLDQLYDERGYDDVDYLPIEQEFPPLEGTVDPTEPPEPFEELGDAPTKIPFSGGDEHDALGGNPGIHKYLEKPGARKAAKNSYNRRLRRSK